MISLLEWQFWQWALTHASRASMALDGKAVILVYILYLPYKIEFSNGRRPG